MNDQERLASLVQQLQSLGGLDQQRYDHLARYLGMPPERFGYDSGGRLHVHFFDAKPYEIRAFAAHDEPWLKLRYNPASLTPDTARAVQNCRVVCIFVNDACNAEVAEQLAAQGVGLVALRCAGFNNVDLEACNKHGISVVRVPDYSPYSVAEHSVALMLTLNRKIHQAYQRNRTGNFELDGLTGFDMRGKTVGVVGTGKIGRCLIDIALGFGCSVIAYDKFPDQETAGRPGVVYESLERLLQQSDIVSLHLPLFPETKYMIDDAAIAQMKPGAMLINTSRGALVDTTALIRGLKSGKIGSAGLDVYEEESGIFFHDISSMILTDDVLARLMTFNNVVITSHQAFLTDEALTGIAETTIANIREFEQGRRGDALTNCVAALT